MRPLTVINLVSLTLMVILFTVGVNCSSATPSTERTPTPLQRAKELEQEIINRRIAIAYNCGFIEGRMKNLDPGCLEYRLIRDEMGNKVSPRLP